MSGVDRLVLRVPEPAVFGTDGGAVLTPRDVNGPSYTELAAGWAVSERPPARWMNFLQHAAGGMQRAALAGAIGDWAAAPVPPTEVAAGMVVTYHPSPGDDDRPGYWAFDPVGDRIFSSQDGGMTWIDRGALGVPTVTQPNGLTIDNTNVLVAVGATVFYNGSVESWGPASEFTGLTSVMAIATRWPVDDYCVVGDQDGQVAYRVNGVGQAGAWATAAAAPSADGAYDATGIASLCFVDGTTWLALTYGGQVWQSSDDADNWSLLATIAGGGTFNFLSRCPHTAALVATQSGVSGSHRARLQYSHDDGATWSVGSYLEQLITLPPLPGAERDWTALKSCGGGAFVATVDDYVSSHPSWWRSVDRGQTWVRWHPPLDATAPDRRHVRAIGCDGQRLVALWESAAPATGALVSRVLDGHGLPGLSL